jgi:hypothetical protein
MKVQQMAFMIIAVFIFFAMVGLFFLSYQSKSLKEDYNRLAKEETITSLTILTSMPELSCGYLCVDEDKVQILSGKQEEYKNILPVKSLKVYKIYPSGNINENLITKCPGENCSYYEILGVGSNDDVKNLVEYSTFVSLCKKDRKFGYAYNKCEIAKLVAGVATAS